MSWATRFASTSDALGVAARGKAAIDPAVQRHHLLGVIARTAPLHLDAARAQGA